ncbi:G-type lectin S-receptor-like serine/threonine-protein kinase [Vitis vinifera]|uniref:non-specific serine/threonine protein kinase n=1 Tax=Vitis vinifera TaxID=29760 RepID=A0A438BSE2_VITVI|nr:G-type lectin S-receptor-like serine/threonine-protein kinase [Vitis vinifera]
MEFLSFMLFCFFFFNSSVALDTMTPNQTLSDHGETLVSNDKSFELGFFSPWNSINRYIGIWFKNVPEQTVVWVANKNNPLTNSSGVLRITSSGNIVIQNSESGIIVWSSNSSGTSPVLQLLNTGNLVVKDGWSDNNSGSFIWQSFDYPCDTIIPGMKLGSNLATGLDWYLTAWKSTQDPSTGEFTYKVDHQGLPQVVLRKGSEVRFRSGPWDGVRFAGSPEIKTINGVFKPIFVFNSTHVYYSFEEDNSTVSRFVLNQSGLIQHIVWNPRIGAWKDIITLNGHECDDNYDMCGPYGICKLVDQTICECPFGFTPKSPQDWNARQTSAGCVARKPLNCRAGEGFRKFKGLKLPDASYLNRTVASPAEYIRRYNEGGQVLHIRMAASELVCSLIWSDSKNKKTLVFPLMMVISSALLLGLVVSWCVVRRRTSRRRALGVDNPNQSFSRDIGEEDLELPLFDLVTIKVATNNFSLANKIGQGGFGLVYKGELPTGQEIAVKRLSEDSGQDQTRGTSITWQKRFDIIVGIARGLLYLHQDSRLRIIHRDLKASNILLDNDMNPKISDFGLARTFGNDQTEVNTNRVIGTYGYMSPEYVIDGLYSTKSDVFSFGVLVLEIVSGKRNRGFYHPDHDLNLVGHAWKLWNEGRPIELVDVFMEGQSPNSQVNPMLPPPKQPGFYTDRYIVETDSSSAGKQPCTPNEVTVTRLQDETYFSCTLYDDSVITRLVVEDTGLLQRFTWFSDTFQWNDPRQHPRAREIPTESAVPTARFLKVGNVKVPDTSGARVEKGWNSKACEEACLRDCSCTAYASISVAGKSRVCLTWYGELIDTVGYNHGGADLYVWVYAFDLVWLCTEVEWGLGQLPDGQEIAMERLSKNSGQGIQEFKNEVALIAKLQHQNLVKVLGSCIEGEVLTMETTLPFPKQPAFIFRTCNSADSSAVGEGPCSVNDVTINRPDMSAVVFMLSNETSLPSPKHPNFAFRRSYNSSQSTHSGTRSSSSVNGVIMTLLDAR